jgi:hypothetical protein
MVHEVGADHLSDQDVAPGDFVRIPKWEGALAKHSGELARAIEPIPKGETIGFTGDAMGGHLALKFQRGIRPVA